MKLELEKRPIYEELRKSQIHALSVSSLDWDQMEAMEEDIVQKNVEQEGKQISINPSSMAGSKQNTPSRYGPKNL